MDAAEKNLVLFTTRMRQLILRFNELKKEHNDMKGEKYFYVDPGLSMHESLKPIDGDRHFHMLFSDNQVYTPY